MWEWVLGLGFRFVVIYLVDLGFAQQLCVCFTVWVVVGGAWRVVEGLRLGGCGFGSWWSKAWWLWVYGG